MATIDLADTQRTATATESAVADAGVVRIESTLVDALRRKGLHLEADARAHGRLLLRAQGKLIAATAPLLKKALEAGTGARQLDLDVAGLTQTDGVGLAVLVRIATIVADAGGSLRVINPSPALRAMMTRIHLHHLIDIVDPAPGDEVGGR
jgi:anti-anti-sigma factor